MIMRWRDGSEIRVRIDNGAVVLSANKEGLLSLADQFADMASYGPGEHVHYDENNSLEEGSDELIVELIP